MSEMMKAEKRMISTESAPAAIGPYAQGIAFGDLVFTLGQLPIDPATGRCRQRRNRRGSAWLM